MSARKLPPCQVCGDPAPVMVATRHGSFDLCYAHEDHAYDRNLA